MRPFFSYHEIDYFNHWLDLMGKMGDEAPAFFHVNWFRKGADGKFLWPGFGDNFRAILWALERAEGRGDYQETPIGLIPMKEALNLEGLDISDEQLTQLLSFDREQWAKEVERERRFFLGLEDEYHAVPKAFKRINAELAQALSGVAPSRIHEIPLDIDAAIKLWDDLQLPGTYAKAVSRVQEQLPQSGNGQVPSVRGGQVIYLSAEGQPLWIFYHGVNGIYHHLGTMNLATGKLLTKDIPQESKYALYRTHSKFLASVSSGQLTVHTLKEDEVTKLPLATPIPMPAIEDIEFTQDGHLIAYRDRKNEPGMPTRDETARTLE